MKKETKIIFSETGKKPEGNYFLIESVFNITRMILECIDQDRLSEAGEMLSDRGAAIAKLHALSQSGTLKEESGNRLKMLLNSIIEENSKLLKRMEEKKQYVLGELKKIHDKKMIENYSL